MASGTSTTFAHTIEVVVEASSPEDSLRRVEQIVQAIHESDALPSGVRVRSYSEGSPSGVLTTSGEG